MDASSRAGRALLPRECENHRVARVVALLAVVAMSIGIGGAGAALPGFTGFWTPSKNIVCGHFRAQYGSPEGLRCDIFSGLRPEPRRACELDWTGISMGPRKRATPTCAGDTVADRSFRVLPYGRTWSKGSFTCLSTRAGVSCANRAGYGFFLSRESWSV
jgi:Family of unknown function (DUF6636)